MVIYCMNLLTVANFRKILFISIWYVFYPNLFLVIFIPKMYSDLTLLITLLLFYFFGALDTLARPFSANEKIDKFSLILISFFFIGPFLLIFAYYEYTLFIKTSFSLYDSFIPVFLGNVLIIAGGLLTTLSRIQIGRFGTGILTIEPDHRLKTDGFFTYIRHPIYFGGLLQNIGLYLAFRTIFMLIFTTFIFFLLFNNRASYEETILENHFQDEYRNYKHKTKRFIPFLY